MDKQTELELEAAAFRVLRDHLRKRTDVQNNGQDGSTRVFLRNAVWRVEGKISSRCQ